MNYSKWINGVCPQYNMYCNDNYINVWIDIELASNKIQCTFKSNKNEYTFKAPSHTSYVDFLSYHYIHTFGILGTPTKQVRSLDYIYIDIPKNDGRILWKLLVDLGWLYIENNIYTS
jgi:hypothetical protein